MRATVTHCGAEAWRRAARRPTEAALRAWGLALLVMFAGCVTPAAPPRSWPPFDDPAMRALGNAMLGSGQTRETPP